MSLELFKKGSRRILEDSKNPGESWKLSKQEMIIQGVPKKRGISECYSVCFTAHLILSLENLFIIYLKVEIHIFVPNTIPFLSDIRELRNICFIIGIVSS